MWNLSPLCCLGKIKRPLSFQELGDGGGEVIILIEATDFVSERKQPLQRRASLCIARPRAKC